MHWQDFDHTKGSGGEINPLVNDALNTYHGKVLNDDHDLDDEEFLVEKDCIKIELVRHNFTISIRVPHKTIEQDKTAEGILWLSRQRALRMLFSDED